MTPFTSFRPLVKTGFLWWLLVVSLLLISLLFWAFSGGQQVPWLLLIGVCTIFILASTLGYFLYQGQMNRLQQQLQQLQELGDATSELLALPAKCESESSFLNAFLSKAVALVEGAEMGSVIVIQGPDRKLHFAAAYGQELKQLQQLNMLLPQTFQYRLTGGRCDRVIIINDTDNTDDQIARQLFGGQLIRATLSSPIYVEGKLYGLLNLDSTEPDCFNDYDSTVIDILSKEAANAVALYQKSQQIHQLSCYDQLTGLANRSYFDQQASQWPLRQQLQSYLILLDIDELKRINEEQGHDHGDEVLRQLANILRQKWPAKALMCRLNGDKFAILSYGEHTQLSEWLQQIRNDYAMQQPGINFSCATVPFNGNVAESIDLAARVIDKHRQ
ncbi:GGDEF domain-containing protein [Shewanella yunxiaonensis]|uniref:diguanylate cyclase n=1 Tax=Shewanella yunxiaonensis TaxID=2829809 RepID=A0ABX7YR87_9GAMM|nr:sensor domain-containing diguanylate cyclase [Shewanella yunxiaonensis]QUN04816.1 GGDEF domain-containing protein [Shewanella yunxiaonensis]